MAKLKVELKQHTPIIHFQHEQSGATIRATELKPKLDRFIMKKIFENRFDKYKHLLIGYEKERLKQAYGGKEAFDYKVKIIGNKVEPKEINKKYPNFFGNRGKQNEEKKFIFNETVSIEFFSFNQEMMEIIRDCFPKFLRNQNFGMRQSKGFGCFYISDNKQYELNGKKHTYTDDEINFEEEWYKFNVDIKDEENAYKLFKEVFEKIQLFYKTLRSGINDVKDKFYFKSMIAVYAYEKMNVQWDKKSIKESYFLEEKNENNKYDKKIIKDVFGLSTEESWERYNNINILVTKEHNKKEIERFKSPIIFKPIKDGSKYTIYFKAVNVDKKFFNQLFKIKKVKKIKKDKKTVKETIRDDLKLNTVSEFNFNNFFEFAFTRNLKKHVEHKYHEEPQFGKIEGIYKQIRKNKNFQEVK